MTAKDFNAEMVWLNSSEPKKRGAAAKAHAISEFKKRFPYVIYPDSKYKLILIRSAKQLGKCFSHIAQIHGRAHY